MSQHGTPNMITMDGGSELANDTIKNLLEVHKINIHITTPKNPNSNSMIERVHSTLIENFRIIREQHKKETPKQIITYAIIGYNNTIHSATKHTPFELIYGHTSTRDPFDLQLSNTYYEEYVTNHKNKLHALYRTIKEDMHKTKEQLIDKRNKSVKDPTYKIGDEVFIKTNARNKSTNKYDGPYTIAKISNRNIATLRSKDRKTKNRHLTELRKHVVTEPSVPSTSQASMNQN